MKKTDHRLGVSEVNLVVRHLKLIVPNKLDIGACIAEIDALYGLDDVSFDQRSQILNVAYDASRICIDCVEEVLQKHGVEVSHDWWTHFKEGYYRFVDQNVKDNAKAEPWSCHQASSTRQNKRR